HQFFVVLDRCAPDLEHFQAVLTTDGTENVDEFVSQIGEESSIGHISTLAVIEGGAYLVWGQYVGSNMLSNLGSFLGGLEPVLTVEVHPLVYFSSKSELELTRLHLRVLKCLKQNPRMSISEIAEKSGLAPKTVRRALREMEESECVSYKARPDLAAGGVVNIHVRIDWDPKRIEISDLIQWLNEEFPVSFWSPWISASDSVVFAEFMVEDLLEAESISKKIKYTPFVKSCVTLVTYSNAKFPYLAELRLEEMLQEAGL
ncbi:MAG: winged helix-turn-helix transcriptional regulator, partial [Candidatus Thorarchaeota archaeon]